MRDLLSRFLVEAAASDERFLVLAGDHGYALFDTLRTRHAERFVNAGVAEQSMIGIAAGLATLGFRPCVYGLASFVPMRVLEQIKLDLCHASVPVILLGDGAGLVYSTLGVSHQCGEDIACLRPLPRIAIYSPCDGYELEACWGEARRADHPSYIRIGKADRPAVHRQPLADTTPQWICRGDGRGEDRLIIGTGAMASLAARIARAGGTPCVSVPRIKPLPEELLAIVGTRRSVAVVEEHTRAGGLYSALAEAIADWESPSGSPRLTHFGLQAAFTTSAGSYEHALSEHQLDEVTLTRRLTEWVATTAERPSAAR